MVSATDVDRRVKRLVTEQLLEVNYMILRRKDDTLD